MKLLQKAIAANTDDQFKIKSSPEDNDIHHIVFYDLEVNQEQDDVIITTFTLFALNTMTQLPIKGTNIDGVSYTYNFELFLDLLIALPMPIYLMAYNGRNYDHHFVRNNLIKRGLLDNVTIDKRKIIGGNIAHITFKCFLQFLTPAPLSQYASLVGVPKLECDITLLTRINAASYLKYAIADTKCLPLILKKFVFVLVESDIPKHLLFDYKILAYVSMAQFCYQTSIKYWTADRYQLAGGHYYFGKESYYGARIDSQMYGQHIKRNIECLDITSMYPAALCNPIPYGKSIAVSHIRHDLHDSPYKHPPCIALVQMSKPLQNIKSQRYGLLPMKYKDRTYYLDSGVLTCILTDVDIYNLIQDGWTLHHNFGGLVFEGWNNDLQAFFTEFFQLKVSCAKDTPQYINAKVKLNATYGKYGQKMRNGKIPYKPCAVSWYCLSYTRVQHRQLKILSIDSSKIYYGDTDSIIIDECIATVIKQMYPYALTNILGTGNKIYYKFEGKANEIVVTGRKSYHMHVKEAHKGIKSITFDQTLQINETGLILIDIQPSKKITKSGLIYILPWTELKKHVVTTIPALCKKCTVCNNYANMTINNVDLYICVITVCQYERHTYKQQVGDIKRKTNMIMCSTLLSPQQSHSAPPPTTFHLVLQVLITFHLVVQKNSALTDWYKIKHFPSSPLVGSAQK